MRKFKHFLIEFFSWVKSFFYLIYWTIAHCVKSDFKNHINKDGCGKTIDIIVNGPSFAKQKDDVINDGNEKCMVNFAANSDLFWVLKPSYYCIADPTFFNNKNDSRKEEIDSFINNIKHADWEIKVFVPYQGYKHDIRSTELAKLSHIHFVPYHSTRLPFNFKFRKLAFWLFRNGQAMPNPMSVSIPVIVNIINAGYSFINLYGYDQDWVHNIVVDENNIVYHRDTHFYNEEGVLRPWRKNERELFRVHEILQTQTELFESYWFIKEYIDYLGDVKIINKSPVSLIDAFDRK